jgi:YebC/PmpR family DNA-binding regulatory protein
MSGHSKWATIRHKKGAIDAKRGKIFTMHARAITVAAQSGGDPEMNPTLRIAIDRAKADNVPNANIDRAVKKGTGEDKDSAIIEELTYEILGPGGSAFMVEVLTDNKNRSLTNLKIAVTKNEGTFGSAGSVAWKFDRKAFLLVDTGATSDDDAELALIDAGADDLSKNTEGKWEVYAAADHLGEARKAMESAGFKVEKDELIWKAKEDLKVTDLNEAKKILKLMEKMEDGEDVRAIHSNVDFAEDLLAHL